MIDGGESIRALSHPIRVGRGSSSFPSVESLSIGHISQIDNPVIAIISAHCASVAQVLIHRTQIPGSTGGEAILSSEIPLPLNINDLDLWPRTKEMPKPREGLAEMSFYLANLEVIKLTAELKAFSPAATSPDTSISIGLRRQSRVKESVKRVERDFLHYCDPSRPLDWFLMLALKAVLVSSDWCFCNPVSKKRS